jgi:hypothetical protein
MKKVLFYFLSLLLAACNTTTTKSESEASSKVDSTHSSQKSIYICDLLFDTYTNNFKNWWATQHIDGPLPGTDTLASFEVKYADLKNLDSIGNSGTLRDEYAEAFFAFMKESDMKSNQIQIVFKGLVNDDTLRNDTLRWQKWATENIKGNKPIGFKIHFGDLDSMYNILKKTRADHFLKRVVGYFVLKSSADASNNQISVVFRLIFSNQTIRVPNYATSCSITSTGDSTSTSFYNLDFTNPCPPCNYSY